MQNFSPLRFVESLTAVRILFRSTDVVYFYRWLERAFMKNVLPPFLLSHTSRCPSFSENVVYQKGKVCVFIFPIYSPATKSEVKNERS